MNIKMANIAAGALLGLIGLGSLPVVAQDFGIAVDQSGIEAFQGRGHDRPYHGREARYGGGCSPREAIAAASHYLNDPQINSTGRGYYNIDGFGKKGGNRGGPDSVRISAAPGCDRV